MIFLTSKFFFSLFFATLSQDHCQSANGIEEKLWDYQSETNNRVVRDREFAIKL